MWLFTPLGFYSVVQHRDDPDTMLVRARVREDLERLRDDHLPGAEVIEGAGTDYRFRVLVPRAAWEQAAAALARDVDYPNFKSEVARTDGGRARVYGRVWEIMWDLQERMR